MTKMFFPQQAFWLVIVGKGTGVTYNIKQFKCPNMWVSQHSRIPKIKQENGSLFHDFFLFAISHFLLWHVKLSSLKNTSPLNHVASSNFSKNSIYDLFLFHPHQVVACIHSLVLAVCLFMTYCSLTSIKFTISSMLCLDTVWSFLPHTVLCSGETIFSARTRWQRASPSFLAELTHISSGYTCLFAHYFECCCYCSPSLFSLLHPACSLLDLFSSHTVAKHKHFSSF